MHPIFCDTLSTLLHSVLASSFPLWQDFSKRASFPIAFEEWLYKKAVWGVVKSWEFEGNLRCSKILRIRRKNPMKWVASISRDYWIYLDITCQSFKIWEFWGEFWGIETFHRSKFSPATGVSKLASKLILLKRDGVFLVGVPNVFRYTGELVRTFSRMFLFFFPVPARPLPFNAGLDFVRKERAYSVESSLQGISSNWLLWKWNTLLAVIQTWSWRGKPTASDRAWLQEANAERWHFISHYEFAICS